MCQHCAVLVLGVLSERDVLHHGLSILLYVFRNWRKFFTTQLAKLGLQPADFFLVVLMAITRPQHQRIGEIARQRSILLVYFVAAHIHGRSLSASRIAG
jgi:hypothetical protein